MIDTETGEILGLGRDVPKEPPFIRTPYNYDMDAASNATGLSCPEETLAQQSAKEDADINTLVKRFGITGEIPILDKTPMMNDIFHDITDFKSAMDALVQAEGVFMTMPADVRARFHNDPQEFLEFTSNEKNRGEMEQMGMLKAKQPDPEPVVVRIKQDPAPDKPAPKDPVT